MTVARAKHTISGMKIVDLANVSRKQTHLYYRREFKAEAAIEIMQQTRSVPVEFVLELRPTGAMDINVVIVEDIDYPLVPIVNGLKTYILELDKRGVLP